MGAAPVDIGKVLLIMFVKRQNARATEAKHDRVRKDPEKVMLNTIVSGLALRDLLDV